MIYESPDGGDTIYQRATGESRRELIRTGPLQQRLVRSQTWRDILQAAESDQVLQEMLDKIEVYHTLKNSPRDR